MDIGEADDLFGTDEVRNIIRKVEIFYECKLFFVAERVDLGAVNVEEIPTGVKIVGLKIGDAVFAENGRDCFTDSSISGLGICVAAGTERNEEYKCRAMARAIFSVLSSDSYCNEYCTPESAATARGFFEMAEKKKKPFAVKQKVFLFWR